MRKSSSIAIIKELATSLIEVIDSLQAEMDNLTFNSDRLKEIEPALAKLQAALRPATNRPVTSEPQPGDLCNICEHKSDTAFACTHDAAQYCANYPESLPSANSTPVKRTRRIKKSTSDGLPPK